MLFVEEKNLLIKLYNPFAAVDVILQNQNITILILLLSIGY